MTQSLRMIAIVCTALLMLFSSLDVTASSARRAAEAEQASLDQACADAREKLLSVERAQLVEECVADKFPRDDRAGCERFYADHGAAAGGRAPLHLDLPECVAAHENRQGR